MSFTSQLLAADFSELGDKVFPADVIEIGGFRINDSVISGFIVVAAILLVALILRLTVIRHWKTTPTPMQMFLEWLVSFFDKSADEMTENYSGLMGPYTFGAAVYICCGVLIEAFGLRPAIADIGACFALALCTFLFIHTFGFMKNKARRFTHYLNPINIITDISVPVSMTFRLFGSIFAVLTPVFTLFHAFIQSYVFASLTLTFVQEAIESPPRKPRKKKKKAEAVSAA